MIIFAIKDKTQMTMLIMWLIELYLNDLGGLKEEGAIAKHEDLEDEFRKFLAQTKVKVSMYTAQRNLKLFTIVCMGSLYKVFVFHTSLTSICFWLCSSLIFFSSELDYKRFLAKLSSRVMF